jgi:hypothetical protein
MAIGPDDSKKIVQLIERSIAGLEAGGLAKTAPELMPKRADTGSISHLHQGGSVGLERTSDLRDRGGAVLIGEMLQRAAGKDAVERVVGKRQEARVGADEVYRRTVLHREAPGRHQRTDRGIDADRPKPRAIRRDAPAAPAAANVERAFAGAGTRELRDRDCRGPGATERQPVGQRDEPADGRVDRIFARRDVRSNFRLRGVSQIERAYQVDRLGLRSLGEPQAAQLRAMRRRRIGAQQHRNALDDRIACAVVSDEVSPVRAQGHAVDRVAEPARGAWSDHTALARLALEKGQNEAFVRTDYSPIRQNRMKLRGGGRTINK